MLDRHTQARAAAVPPTEQPAEREQKVIIEPCWCWEITGSRAQLEADGIKVPADAIWPEGTGAYRWRSGRCKFELSRALPNGLKGPRRNHPDLDWWCVSCRDAALPGPAGRAILLKQREIEAEMRRQSPNGQREAATFWYGLSKASQDGAFQAFKSRLLQRKRGREPKTDASSTTNPHRPGTEGAHHA
ncbi:hypothetical protein [Rubrivivax gelatinosus]|uniref:Uncharacterized protein n=1 Tax=Rubrivivax gelatinosus TaxID=28068 RepID=A0A4R2MJJ1_RUBGE|nr:hypothetical protein [Rubrivivax gelatinosus]MBK1688885.1 hypothetical protein [Rubrivivax gelatinosus]TCP03076.1 hypothetical protein EV684_105242 [Rubrivivax gelatinosus]